LNRLWEFSSKRQGSPDFIVSPHHNTATGNLAATAAT